MAYYKRKSFADKKKEVDQLAADRNEQVENYFRSPEDMKEYLSFMSKFYNYSVRNSTLIQNQFQGAEAVGSYNFWKKEGYQVQKGEKGISILVPAPFKTFERKKGDKTERVNVKQATKTEKAAIDRGEIKTKEWMAYAKGNVFDVSQTNAKAEDLPKIFPNKWLEGSVENYEEMFQSMQKLGKEMGVETITQPDRELGAAKGAYVEFTQRNTEGEMVQGKGIELNPRNSELQNVKTMIHELAHADLHNSNSKGHDRSHPEKEFQAEMTAYTVSSHFNLDTSDYSLQYIKAYSSEDNDLNDKFALLEEVKDTSYKFISHLEKDLEPVKKQVEEKKSVEELKEEFSVYHATTRNGLVKVEDMDIEQFSSTFRAEDGRNILGDKAFQEGSLLERVQAFNQVEENWNSHQDNVKFVDGSKQETQYYVVNSEKPLKQNVMTGEEMDKYLAAENLDSLKNTNLSYDKTRIQAIVPTDHGTDREYHTRDIDRIDLGDGEYYDLRSHISPTGVQVPQGIPKMNDHLKEVYNKETVSKTIESVYTDNLYLNKASVKDHTEIERSDLSVKKIESFAVEHNYLTPDDVAAVKQGTEEKVSDHKDQMDTQNVMVNLKGNFENIQQKKKEENTGELTEDMLINRMEAENRYQSTKLAVLDKEIVKPGVIQNMESSILQKYERGIEKGQAPSNSQTSGKDTPFPSETSKQKNAGMSM